MGNACCAESPREQTVQGSMREDQQGVVDSKFFMKEH